MRGTCNCAGCNKRRANESKELKEKTEKFRKEMAEKLDKDSDDVRNTGVK